MVLCTKETIAKMATANQTPILSNNSFIHSTALELNYSCCSEEETQHMPFAILYSLIFPLGLAGNLPALWVLIFLLSQHISVCIFHLNMALAYLVPVACLPFCILNHMLGNYWPPGLSMHKLLVFMLLVVK